MRLCEIVYVKQGKAGGWRWRPLGEGPQEEVCAESYALFYECVLAARKRGYEAKLRCR